MRDRFTGSLAPERLQPNAVGWLKPFLDRAARESRFTRSQCSQILAEALLLFEQLYVHLPQKRSAYGVDPVQQLRLFAHRVEKGLFDDRAIAFHEELSRIFRLVRDLHTNYVWPAPFTNAAAILPFQIECYFEKEGRAHKPRFIVSSVNSGFRHGSLRQGVEVTHWNGIPIAQAVEINGRRTAASNDSAVFARGLHFLTVRPMSIIGPPEEEWVTIRHIGRRNTAFVSRFRWQVIVPRVETDAAPVKTSPAMGMDYALDLIRRAKKGLFAPKIGKPRAAPSKRRAKPGETRFSAEFQKAVEAREEIVDGEPYGYLRIRTFNVHPVDRFIASCIELIKTLPENGLVIDVRDNGGGLISAAERLLQIFSAGKIEPAEFQFINSPLTLELCRKPPAKGTPNPDLNLDFTPWRNSIERSLESGAIYSQPLPMTSRDSCNIIGRQYPGPVVLIVNALCYSATDMFAAGFQDNGIGPVVGVDGATGAGGANSWPLDLLASLSTDRVITKELPNGANFTVAARRTLRAGLNRGMELENFGVEPDHRYYMRKVDLLNHNVDLIGEAVRIMNRHARASRTRHQPR